MLQFQSAKGAFLGGALVFFTACGSADNASSGRDPQASDAPPVVSVLLEDIECVDTWVEGDQVDLVYAQTLGEESKQVHHMRSMDGGASWNSPVRIDAGAEAVAGTHQWSGPQIASHGEHLVALWTTGGTGFMGRGPLVSVTSQDGGKTWNPGPGPGTPTDRGPQAFPDLAVDEAGEFHVIWLGSQEGVRHKSLLYASSVDDGGTWTAPAVVDEKVCECCWNRLVVGPEQSLYALYRDHSPRDMAVARLQSGQDTWETLGRAGEFNWAIDGCPHVGGALLALDDELDTSIHAMVWTGESQEAGAHYLRSTDAGDSWESPVKIGQSGSTNCDIASNSNGLMLMTWDSTEAAGTFVYASASNDAGQSWSQALRISMGQDDQEKPLIITQDDGFRVLWLETIDGITNLKSTWLSNEDLIRG